MEIGDRKIEGKEKWEKNLRIGKDRIEEKIRIDKIIKERKES